jgi:hypothetical protein
MKKNKQKLPTVDEFLTYHPVRGDFPWITTDDGLIHITVPKFSSKIGISFCKTLRKENIFTANLDKLGSVVWKHCDGKTTVKTILEQVQKEFPDEKNIDQRLFLFIQQMQILHYLDY